MSRKIISYIVSVLLITACAGTVQSQSSPFDQMARYRTQTNIVGYPPLADTNSIFAEDGNQPLRYIRMTGFASDGTLTQAKAEAYVKQRAAEGFNCLIAESTRYVFRDSQDEYIPPVSGSPVYEKIMSDCTFAAKASRKYGLKYFLHVTSTMVTPGVLQKHPDWAVIDLVTKKPVLNGYGMMVACINNDDFMKTYFGRIEPLIRQTDADGIMMDEIQFFAHTECGCKSCREKFHKETGYKIPDDINGWLLNFKDISYVNWLKWRRAQVVKHMRYTTDLIKKYGKDKINITYLARASAGSSYVHAGWVVNDAATYADYIGYENEPEENMYFYYWQQTFAEAKYVGAVAEKTKKPMWTLWYNRRGGDCVWNWITSLTLGSSSWVIDYPDITVSWQPQVAWEKQHARILGNSTPCANIGVLFSLYSRDHDPRGLNDPTGLNWIHGFFSTSYALIDGHIPYRVVLDEHLSAAELKGLNTLFLFDTCSMSNAQIAVIKEFVKSGGTVIASGDMAIFDENGQDANSLRLADVLGCTFGATVKGPAYLAVEDRGEVFGGLEGKFVHGSNFVKVENISDSARVIGKFITDDGVTYPGIILNRYHKGTVIYFAGHPERHYLFSYYNQPVISPGKYWPDKRVAAYGNMICRAAAYQNRDIPVIASNIPVGVVVEPMNQHVVGIRGIQVHLANFLGSRISDGQVPMYNEISFPDVHSFLPNPYLPMEIAVRSDDIKQVFMVSPDFDKIVSLPFTKQDSYTMAVIPKLYRYAMVYFVQDGDPKFLADIKKQSVTSVLSVRQLVTQTYEPLAAPYIPNSITVFADTPEVTGGYNSGLYMKERGVYLYGAQSRYPKLTCTMQIPVVPKNPVLQIGAIDDGSPGEVHIKIAVNGKDVYDGPSGLKHQWAVKEFPLSANVLKQGENIITVANMDKGPGSGPPWIGFNFFRVKGN